MRTGCGCRAWSGATAPCSTAPPQPLPDGATLLTFVDVTASVNVERALTEKNEALERASRLRDDFVHHVSYELRSPLTNIIGFTQLLGDETVGALNPRQREYAGHIMRSSSALLAIINDILDLASIDTGALELTLGAGRHPRHHRGGGARLAGPARRIHAARSRSTSPADIGSFVADGKRVRQMLFNLLSNAIGFSSPGQTVTRQRRARATARSCFRCATRAAASRRRSRTSVFDRFESHTLGTRHRGVGLGLSIVRSFVELHGGRVELDSDARRAAPRVTCIFPADGAPPAARGRIDCRVMRDRDELRGRCRAGAAVADGRSRCPTAAPPSASPPSSPTICSPATSSRCRAVSAPARRRSRAPSSARSPAIRTSRCRARPSR